MDMLTGVKHMCYYALQQAQFDTGLVVRLQHLDEAEEEGQP